MSLNLALFVSGDSGLAHVASAVRTAVLGPCGPTRAGRYGLAVPYRNLQSPFVCPELNPMNFTLQRCWAAECCIVPGKATCCADLAPARGLAARELLGPARLAAGRRIHA